MLIKKSVERWRRDVGITELIEHLDQPKWKNSAGVFDPVLLGKKEVAAVFNEIEQCGDDFSYFARNYAAITNKKGQDLLLSLNEPQELLLEEIYRLWDLGRSARIMILKSRQLGMCLDPNTRVLTADLRWIPIGEIVSGQELVSVDEMPSGGRGNGRKMRKATAVCTRMVHEEAFRITMDNGEVLIATGPHRFLCKRRGSVWTEWRSVTRQTSKKTSSPIRVGDEIRYITQPWSGTSYEDGWFSGMLDGEGSLSSLPEGSVSANVAQVLGPVYDRAVRYLKSRGYNFTVEMDVRTPENSTKFGSKNVAKLVVGRMNEVFRLIGQTRPERFLRRPWWEGRDLPGKRTGASYSKVVSIEALGKSPMIDLQTTTGTFIAEGFVSHNSTVAEALVAWKAMFTPNTASLIVSVASNVAQLFAIALHIIEQLPPWLRPMVANREYQKGIVFDNPIAEQRRSNPGMHSFVVVQSWSQMSGIGQGLTLRAAHLSEYTDADPHQAREAIEGDTKEALSEEPGTFAILESTGKGAGTYSHKLWRKNVELGDEAEWVPKFFPWFVDKKHILPPPLGWHTDRPDVVHEKAMRDRVADEWVKCSVCARFKESYVRGEHIFGSDCTFCGKGKFLPLVLSDEQLAWIWRRRINAEKDAESLKTLRAEQCTTAEEAWQISGIQVFPQECIDFVQTTVRDPIARGYLDERTGTFHGVKELIKDGRGFDIGSKCWEEHCTVDHRGAADDLWIWEWPQKDEEYSVAADVADGLGGEADYCVGWVNRIGRGMNPDYQVAMFRSNEIPAMAFATPLNILGRWYGEGMMAVEYNACGGTTANTLVYRYQYPNIYRWKHLDSLRPQTHTLHWFSQSNSKPLLWQTAVQALKQRIWIIRSKEFLNEMTTFQKGDYDEKSASAEYGMHDDVVMAAMICFYTTHEMDWDANSGYLQRFNKAGDQTSGRFKLTCTRPSCRHGKNGDWLSDDPNFPFGCPVCQCRVYTCEQVGVQEGLKTIPEWEVGFNTDSDMETEGNSDMQYDNRYS